MAEMVGEFAIVEKTTLRVGLENLFARIGRCNGIVRGWLAFREAGTWPDVVPIGLHSETYDYTV